ncbi:carbamoyl phosphate synthase large subunit, partial [Pseudomonas otitidis]|nr:carbamoyl phosphate synthase large subunit [Pseudomonas otitidis]
TKISLGIRLDAIRRTGFSNLTAASEPIMDYLAVKVPNWSKGQAKRLGTRRQAKGQIVAFGRSLESALMKAIESMTNERIDSMLTQFLNIDDFQLEENL